MSKDIEQEGSPLRLRTALRQGDATGVVAALEACCDASFDTEVLEVVLVEGERSLAQFDPHEARLVADALRGVAVTLIRGCEDAPQEDVESLEGSIALVTMAGDRHDVGRYLWHAVLRRHGLTVHDLGRRPPAIAVARGSALNVDAFGLYLDSRLARSHVQTFVSLLQRRRLRTPVLLGGPAVDEAFARWVATPGGGEPYWGGVYYCEDALEAVEVLRQIILFTPPPAAHTHEIDLASTMPTGCATCGGCSLAESCDELRLPDPH